MLEPCAMVIEPSAQINPRRQTGCWNSMKPPIAMMLRLSGSVQTSFPWIFLNPPILSRMRIDRPSNITSVPGPAAPPANRIVERDVIAHDFLDWQGDGGCRVGQVPVLWFHGDSERRLIWPKERDVRHT